MKALRFLQHFVCTTIMLCPVLIGVPVSMAESLSDEKQLVLGDIRIGRLKGWSTKPFKGVGMHSASMESTSHNMSSKVQLRQFIFPPGARPLNWERLVSNVKLVMSKLESDNVRLGMLSGIRSYPQTFSKVRGIVLEYQAKDTHKLTLTRQFRMIKGQSMYWLSLVTRGDRDTKGLVQTQNAIWKQIVSTMKIHQ